MNERKVKIRVSNITKKFELMKTRSEKILNLFNFSSSKKNRDFWALKGVSFEVYAGEAIGIVGLNGSGKSTLLNIVSEIYPPTTGQLEINGDTSIISIGAGLKSTLTGRDNIRLKLLMSGLSNKQIKEVMPTIIEFSELGDFIEQPVKSYSSGMKSKLGFSIMAHTNPDIMIIDEALSVGDSTFAKKSFDKIREFKEQGKTIFFVSHSGNQVKQIADRVIWMHFGEMKEVGPTKDVMLHYEKWQSDFNKQSKIEREKYIVNNKHEQRSFSVVDIAKQQLNMSDKQDKQDKQESRIQIKKAKHLELEQKKLIKKATRKTKKQVQSVKFGFINWILVCVLVVLIGYLSTDVLANSQANRDRLAKDALTLKNKKREKEEKSINNSNKTKSKERSSFDSEQQSIEQSSSVIENQQSEDTTSSVEDTTSSVVEDSDTSETEVDGNQEVVVPDTIDQGSAYYQPSTSSDSQIYESASSDASTTQQESQYTGISSSEETTSSATSSIITGGTS